MSTEQENNTVSFALGEEPLRISAPFGTITARIDYDTNNPNNPNNPGIYIGLEDKNDHTHPIAVCEYTTRTAEETGNDTDEQILRILIRDNLNTEDETYPKEIIILKKPITEELQNCPCCETPAEVAINLDEEHKKVYSVICANCGMTTGCHYSKYGEIHGLKKAISIWNTRPQTTNNITCIKTDNAEATNNDAYDDQSETNDNNITSEETE